MQPTLSDLIFLKHENCHQRRRRVVPLLAELGRNGLLAGAVGVLAGGAIVSLAPSVRG